MREKERGGEGGSKRASLKVKFSLYVERVVGGIKEANTRSPYMNKELLQIALPSPYVLSSYYQFELSC